MATNYIKTDKSLDEARKLQNGMDALGNAYKWLNEVQASMVQMNIPAGDGVTIAANFGCVDAASALALKAELDSCLSKLNATGGTQVTNVLDAVNQLRAKLG
jgi:hypothetical protein